MAHLQVKNLPDDLHHRLRARAEAAGMSLSEYVTQVLRRDVTLPTIDEWLAEQQRRPLLDADVNVTELLDEVRGEFGPNPA